MDEKDILTEDGQVVRKGDRVFNYYDVKWGVIAENPDRDGWFRVDHEDGTHATLNGPRICSYQPEWVKK